MKLQRKHIAIAAGLFVLAGIGWRLSGHDHDSDGGASHGLDRPVPVTMEQVTTGSVPLYASGVGTVQAYNTVNVQVRVDGQLESVNFREGQSVKAGDRLAQIDPRPYQAALDNALANLAKDEATLMNAKRDLVRYEGTARKGYTTDQQRDTQAATVGALAATVQADQATIENARVQLGYTTVTSPIDGRTGIRHIDKGNIVHAADAGALVVITQLQPISLIFTLPQDLLPGITTAELAGPLPVTAFSRDGKTVLGEGVLELVDNEIDPSTGTIRLKARFPNAAQSLWPGQFVNARLELGAVGNGLTVDSRVVQRGPNGVFAYIVKPDDTVEMRAIEVGQDYGGRTLVTHGLNGNERVVVDGQLRVEPGTKVSSVPEQPRQTGSLAPESP